MDLMIENKLKLNHMEDAIQEVNNRCEQYKSPNFVKALELFNQSFNFDNGDSNE